ncbi:NADH dehydrogenase [Echinococcus multilocularis]|uniref:NADH dehydrogenase [ubiquinone] 1 alpha subcomplex subunit 2 n=1 Tax=Echinococcus multilocularis TaxID=6211 RepID=A0A068YIV2_ECHMU|nr:NADH dehydrogenase [Echinococcus multilocularis]
MMNRRILNRSREKKLWCSLSVVMTSVPRFSSTVKELRILFSPVNASSAGVREFIGESYVGLRNSNPGVNFMLREGNSISPRIYARYSFGKESFVSVDNASPTEIMDKICKLAKT